jgi:hypothetical protein
MTSAVDHYGGQAGQGTLSEADNPPLYYAGDWRQDF